MASWNGIDDESKCIRGYYIGISKPYCPMNHNHCYHLLFTLIWFHKHRISWGRWDKKWRAVRNLFWWDCFGSRGECLWPTSHHRAASSGAVPIDQALDGLNTVTKRTICCKFNIAELMQDTFVLSQCGLTHSIAHSFYCPETGNRMWVGDKYIYLRVNVFKTEPGVNHLFCCLGIKWPLRRSAMTG